MYVLHVLYLEMMCPVSYYMWHRLDICMIYVCVYMCVRATSAKMDVL